MRVFPNRRFKHGYDGTPLYRLWIRLKERCLNPRWHAFHYYGGRGVTLFEPWVTDFPAFRNYIVSALGEAPRRTTLDRIDNSRGYEPGNLRWATNAMQAQNRRSVKLSIATVDAIRGRVRSGEPQRSIARDFQVNQSTISRVVTQRLWVKGHNNPEVCSAGC